MIAPVAAQRVLRGVTATINVTFADQNGEPAAAAGTVTVDVTKADGTAVVTGGTTSAGTGTGAFTYSLAAQANLELLTVVWKDNGAARLTTLVEVVGGYYFTVAEARAFDNKITLELATDAKIIAVRREVEDECERITGCAWVPRYRLKRYDPGWGQGRLLLDDWAPRAIRSVKQYSSATQFVAYTNAELAAVSFTEWGQLTRRDGQAWWGTPGGTVVEYEYGYDAPPPDLKHACLTRLRSRLYMEKTGIPDRATSFTSVEGGTFAIATPGQGVWETGLPEVDAVYARYCVKSPGIA